MGRFGDDRSRLAQGLAGAAVVTTIGLEFTLPCVLGVLIDGRLGTSPAAALIGAVLGFVVGTAHAIRLGGGGRPSGKPGGRD